ncbi:uncharacterized protein LOC142583554 [Dermacentor variabilis]|uniref:uncharacterized protein LOC142583554 n=1 Tax=Dermacentor variabilis TaxID=34621 RepID=UPI003F5BD485
MAVSNEDVRGSLAKRSDAFEQQSFHGCARLHIDRQLDIQMMTLITITRAVTVLTISHSLGGEVLLVNWTLFLARHYSCIFCLQNVQKGSFQFLRRQEPWRISRFAVLFYTTWVRHNPVRCFLFSIVSSFRLFTGLSSSPALLLLLHSCFQLRSTSVPNALLHDSTVCAPKDYFGHEHHLFQERLLLLLHSLASGVLLIDWTSPRLALLLLLHSCFRLRWVPSTLLHILSLLRSKRNYFGRQHHSFHERLLLLLRSLADGVLLADWTLPGTLALNSGSLCLLSLVAQEKRSSTLIHKDIPGLASRATIFSPIVLPCSIVNASHACLGGFLHCDGVFML